jgi:NitT/TauT family transport system ATP-binding protein
LTKNSYDELRTAGGAVNLSMNPILSFQHISYSYHGISGETPAIEDLSFDVREGEFLTIVGPSGCGKSTLLSIIAGLLEPDEGTVRIRDTEREKSDVNIGYMLQRDHLLEWKSTYQNAALGLLIQKKKADSEKFMLLNHLFQTYGLVSFEKAKPSELSGGMRQRVALTRTLVMEPDLLLLDEPFSALDYQTRLQVSDDIWKIIKKEKKTAILITHDISEAISMGDRVLVLTGRPAKLKKEIAVHLSFSDEVSPFKARSTPEFQNYFNEIWEEMNRGD